MSTHLKTGIQIVWCSALQNIPLFSAWFEVIFEGSAALTVELPLSGFVSPSPPQGEYSQTCP